MLTMRTPSFFTKAKFGGSVAAAAGLTTSAASATGSVIDKEAVTTNRTYQGVRLSLPVEVVLDSGQSLSVALTIKDSTASGGTFASFATATTTLTNSTTSTGVTTRGVAVVEGTALDANQWLTAHVAFTGSAADTGGDRTASAFQFDFFGPNAYP